MKLFRNYKYKGLTFVAISIPLTIFLSKYSFLNDVLLSFQHTPFLGSFIAGILYASASTATLGILMLSGLTKTLSSTEIAIIAGLGVVVADFVIFRFFRNSVMEQLTPMYNRLGGQHLTKLMHRKLLRWSLPIIGAFIIASPFPDEIGIVLMGISKIKDYQFILLSLFLNVTGLFLLISAFTLIK